MNISMEARVILDIRRQIVTNKLFTTSVSHIISKFEAELKAANPDIKRLAHIASHDTALTTKIIDIANKTVQYQKGKLYDSVMPSIQRIGVVGLAAVLQQYKYELLRSKICPAWLHAFDLAARNSTMSAIRAFHIAESYRSQGVLAMQLSVLYAASTFAQVVSCSNLKIPISPDIQKYALTPHAAVSEAVIESFAIPAKITDSIARISHSEIEMLTAIEKSVRFAWSNSGTNGESCD